MKISNSKKELARIISENGGWCGAANLALFGKVSGRCYMLKTDERPEYDITIKGFYINARDVVSDFHASPFTNWHQTILSRAEYFHLYPAPDADGWIEWRGGECPVEKGTLVDVIWMDGRERIGVKALQPGGAGHQFWVADGIANDIIAYRLHKPDAVKPTDFGAIGDDETNLTVKDGLESMEYRPTIEQLAADYRSAKDYAERKQQEADAAKADAEAKLADLVTAGKALGLELSVAGVEPGLVITEIEDLLEGDVIELTAGGALQQNGMHHGAHYQCRFTSKISRRHRESVVES